MANPADIPISRAQVQKWIKSWKRTSKVTRKPIEDYIRTQVDKLELDDPMVEKAGRNGETLEVSHIADLIIDDLESYGVQPSS